MTAQEGAEDGFGHRLGCAVPDWTLPGSKRPESREKVAFSGEDFGRFWRKSRKSAIWGFWASGDHGQLVSAARLCLTCPNFFFWGPVGITGSRWALPGLLDFF
ncbi:hypothetical protein CRG98_010158 [Punica granatum]|uniref:Uncharacterized protein n=1 Tax=Punica granatum TaxID=22663 RepID=A0A2I0KLU1_PUNGR|nr:hypothetical protein CRG98_010158 [Punica granatum]